ncbi:MAG: phenylacetate--CoA ligase, partial [Desulfovibrionaceae bacterium]|nr:phenylacetate--CoA ligase [Desulfovibrionaceae bacterium]
RVLVAGGVTKDDVVQIAHNYGLFTGGFGFHYGAERIGASVIPSSGGNPRRQVTIMQDYKTTALVSTPSYALYLADVMDEMGVSPNALNLKYGLFGGETWSEAMRQEIQQRLNIMATDDYGISEVMGPGISGECAQRRGLHVNEDHFLVEIVDPETLAPRPLGEPGEMVITTLAKEAFPLIRYRTGDLTRLIDEPCACGRTSRRMDRVLGRSDDMLIIQGINVFPSQIEALLLDVEGVEPHYQIVVEREGALDKATVLVEAPQALFTDRIREAQQTIQALKKKLDTELGISFEVKLVEGKSLERSQGKAVRVVDKRTF